MYWMRAEGLADDPTVRALSGFLAVPADTLGPFLERFEAEGLIEPSAGGYRLTPSGEEMGKRSFADEFADVTRPGHGECDEDCWCNAGPEEAASCLEGKKQHAHN